MCGKPGCKGKGICTQPIGDPKTSRNGVLAGYSDDDQGPNTQNAQRVDPITKEQAGLYFQAQQARYSRLLATKIYDTTHPVDEYAPQGESFIHTSAVLGLYGTTVTLNLLPDYDMPVRYENISVLIPSAALYVTLQLGQRTWVLRTQQQPVSGFGGAVLTDIGQMSPTWMTLPYTGVILNADDPRILTVQYQSLIGPNATSGQPGSSTASYPALQMSGFALTRGQWT